MILGIGIAIIEVERIQASYEKFGDRFLNRILHQNEINYCLSHRVPGPFLAARFAAKEATIKALGSSAVGLHEVEVVRPAGRRPELRLGGRAAAVAAEIGVEELALSLSHSRDYAVAMVVLRHAGPHERR